VLSQRHDPAEERLGWLLCLPAVLAMLLVTAYPILYAVWLSLFRDDLRFPDQRAFVGLANYSSVLTSPVWWESLANTAIITLGSVTLELVLGVLSAPHPARIGAGALCHHHGGRCAGVELRVRPGHRLREPLARDGAGLAGGTLVGLSRHHPDRGLEDDALHGVASAGGPDDVRGVLDVKQVEP
jgi:hypothetical protein